MTQRVEACRALLPIRPFTKPLPSIYLPLMAASASSYSEAERALIERVEKKMELMMSKYDPSHDAYHGKYLSILSARFPV